MDLVIFHYHFHSGGVSASIRGGIRALRQSSRRIGSIRLVVGEASEPTALSRELGATTLVLNPGHNLTRAEITKGVGFFDIMEENLRNLKNGLGCR